MIDLARNEYFQRGDVHTGFIGQHFDTLFSSKTVSDDLFAQAAIGVIVNENNASVLNSVRTRQMNDPFILNRGFRVNSNEVKTLSFLDKGKEVKVSITQNQAGFKVKVNNGKWSIVSIETADDMERFMLKVNMDGSVFNVSYVITPEKVIIFNEVNFTDIL